MQGLHIHTGAAGAAGGVTIGTDLSASNNIVSETGVGTITKQAPATSANALSTLNGMMRDPSQYYVNLHTSDHPGGAIRGQLERAEVAFLMGMMSPRNENPPIDSPASGVAHVIAIATRNAAGAYTSGQVILAVDYNLGAQTNITGFHIHTGAAGVNGGVTINAIPAVQPAPVQSGANGVGSLRYPVEVNVANAAQVNTLYGLFTTPENFYINLHTTEALTGLIRDQLRRTDLMTFDMTMLPSNETPPVTGLDATAPSQFRLRTIRNEDGTVLAGIGEFDVNYRFPGAATFVGLHVHDGAAGASGPVRLNSRLTATSPVVTETGFGNIYLVATLSDANAVASMNSVVQNPERHYLNLHTTVNPTGAVREQLTPANNRAPVISRGGNAANGGASAPAGLISIYGTDLAKVAAGIDGWKGSTLPSAFNGVGLTIGGAAAPILYVSDGQVNAQVPVNAAAGPQPAVITTPNGSSAPVNVTIAATAPAIFADPANGSRAIATHQDFSLVGPASPARIGETVIFWVTGLGQTTPALTTGALVAASPFSNTGTVTATIGGTSATVVSSVAAPGLVGVYQVAVTVPNVALGDLPVVLTIGGANSSSLRMWVQ
jgi:uncharacterized protein (TIGR03437 family)